MILRVINRSDPLRRDIEDFVRGVFARQHSAVVREFPERLVAVLGPGLSPLCASGIRTAEDGFFSEFYLGSPVESVLARISGTSVQRSQIIEVTSLASDRPGHTFALLDYITQLGRDGGRSWGLFTATERMRRWFERAGLTFTMLATANAEAVPNREDWGRYYDSNPAVCVMHDRCEQPISFQRMKSQPTAFGAPLAMEAQCID